MVESNTHNSIGKCIHYHLKKFFDMHGSSGEPTDLYSHIMHEVEKALIIETMKYSGGVKAKATKVLGINRNTLSKKMKNLEIKE
ncbi:MAG: helix-turn-helix domain-containing protein [Pseudomonadota bacterium]